MDKKVDEKSMRSTSLGTRSQTQDLPCGRWESVATRHIIFFDKSAFPRI